MERNSIYPEIDCKCHKKFKTSKQNLFIDLENISKEIMNGLKEMDTFGKMKNLKEIIIIYNLCMGLILGMGRKRYVNSFTSCGFFCFSNIEKHSEVIRLKSRCMLLNVDRANAKFAG